MSDLSIYPQEDNFSTRLASAAAAADVTIIVNTNVSFTFSDSFRIVVEPGTSNAEPMLVTGISGTTWTVTRAQKRYSGDTGSAITHPAGSTVIISDNFGAWDDIKTAVNTKADTASPSFTGEMVVPVFADATARDAAIAAPTNGAECYLTTEGKFTDYTGGAWADRASGTNPNASETVAGKVELATNAEMGTGTSTGGSGARLVAPNDQLVKASSGAGDENKLAVLNASGQFADGFIASPADAALTAKGSIYAASAASTPAEFTVGSNGKYLMADTKETTGLRYERPRSIFYTANSWSNTSVGSGTVTESLQQVRLATGASTNDYENITTDIMPVGQSSGFTRERYSFLSAGDIIEMEVNALIFSGVNANFVIGIMNSSGGVNNKDTVDQKAIFKLTGGTLESSTADGTTEEDQTVSGVTLTNGSVYKIRFVLGTSVEFYVDGTLKTTHSTNIPTVSDSVPFGPFIGIQTTAAAAKNMYMGRWINYTVSSRTY